MLIRVLLRLAALGVGVVAYASVVERNWFAVRRHRIPCLPAGSPPMTILHISDLHLRAQQRRKRRFIAGLDDLKPDLVVGTGDFLGDASSVEATVEAMGALSDGRPSVFVLGSNDYYGPRFKSPLRYFVGKRKRRPAGEQNPWPEMVDGLRARGWTYLSNERTTIDGIDVVGLDDAHIGRADTGVATRRTGGGFRLAVAHSPDGVEVLAPDYDLIVCGHTHGGQVRLPGVGALITNSQLPRRMARGVHRLGEAWLHVCAGLGTSMFAPYRFACRPEACLLELVARDEG